MDEQAWQRIVGAERLIHEGVARVTDLVERHHRHTAAKPFDLLESLAPIAGASRVVRTVHDGVLTITYGGVRVVNGLTEIAGGWLLHQLAARHIATSASRSASTARQPGLRHEAQSADSSEPS
jgi:hypothetical protein